MANLTGISLGRQYAAEAGGTFLLVFTGTGAMLFNELSGGVIGALLAVPASRALRLANYAGETESPS